MEGGLGWSDREERQRSSVKGYVLIRGRMFPTDRRPHCPAAMPLPKAVCRYIAAHGKPARLQTPCDLSELP